MHTINLASQVFTALHSVPSPQFTCHSAQLCLQLIIAAEVILTMSVPKSGYVDSPACAASGRR